MSFPEQLRSRRQALGLPQFEVAHRVDVSLRTYTRWESGELEPRVSDLQRLADVLEIPVAVLVAEPEPAPNGGGAGG